jgi:hypothetical protein
MICVIGEIVSLSTAVYADWPSGFKRKNAWPRALHNEETTIERKRAAARPPARY